MKKSGILMLARGVAAIGLILGVMDAIPIVSGASTQRSLASYNGGPIDLSQGWGSAQICSVTSAGTYCFASQYDYQTWAATNPSTGAANGSSPMTSCSSGLDLYENINYGGRELILSSQSNWINLSIYGFSDIVSSFKVGACSIRMTDAANGAGSAYPGPTTPSSLVPWIGTAWNDRIQSVYVY